MGSMDELQIGAGTPEPDKPKSKPESKPLELRQDWIVTVKLTETIENDIRRRGLGMTQENLSYEILTRLQRIEGVKVQQVRAFADGPGYY